MSSNSTGIIVVLMFGVGTDYCLLLVSRYREELRRFEDKHEAMQRAVRRAGPGDPGQRADRLSGDARARPRRVRQHASRSGPVAAIAVLHRDDRRAHAAARPADDLRPEGILAQAEHRRRTTRSTPRSCTRSLAALRRRVLHRPGLALAVTAVRLPARRARPDRLQGRLLEHHLLQESVQSVEGFKVLRQTFPAGTLSPTTVLVEQSGGPVTPQDIALAAPKLRRSRGSRRWSRPARSRPIARSPSSTSSSRATRTSLRPRPGPEDARRGREPHRG